MNGARRVLKRFAGAAVAGVVLGWAIAGMDRALAQPADLLVGQSAALSGPTMGVAMRVMAGCS
jgi:hypothetical protein